MTGLIRCSDSKTVQRMLGALVGSRSHLWRRQGLACIVLPPIRASASTLPKIRKVAVGALTPARTRFAPSPTGFLHLGSLRTAIFNYLWAKKTGGQFILRIEDTDQKRTVTGAEQRLFDDLRWAGLLWDEGPMIEGKYGPYKQSGRNKLYKLHVNELIDSGHAYKCFCPAVDAADDEPASVEVGAKLGGCSSDCKGLSKDELQERLERNESFVVRFWSKHERIHWKDLVYGDMLVKADSGSKMFNSIADTVLMKSDGTPTYHLANVVDDHDMKITHVIRGTEWMPSTGLHVALYEAFRWQPPTFAHVSLLTDEHHNKLSKRNFDVDVASLIQKFGLLPESLVNYLVLLGWSNPDKKDVKSMQELIDAFDLKFSKGDTVVTHEKLFYLQRQHAWRRVKEAISDPTAQSRLDVLIDHLRNHKRVYNMDPVIKKEVLGNRPMNMYLRSILVIDPGTYDTPGRYLNVNNYFFRRKALRTDQHDDRVEENDEDESDSYNAQPAEQAETVSKGEPDLTYPSQVAQMVDEIVDHDLVRKSLDLWKGPPEELPQNVKELHDLLAKAAQSCQDILNKLLAEKVVSLLADGGAEVADTSVAVLKKTAEWKQLTVDFHKHLRYKLSGKADGGPSTFRVMAVLGYDESRLRIRGSDTVQ